MTSTSTLSGFSGYAVIVRGGAGWVVEVEITKHEDSPSKPS